MTNIIEFKPKAAQSPEQDSPGLQAALDYIHHFFDGYFALKKRDATEEEFQRWQHNERVEADRRLHILQD